MIHRFWQRTTGGLFVALMVVAVAAAGCEDTPEDHLADGKRALADRDLDSAQQRFEAALDAEPGLVEARRLLATTFIRDGEYELAEQTLRELWDDEDFDNEADLSADERQTRQLMSEHFSELYRSWGQSIDAEDQPGHFEDVVRRGLERNSRDGTLNQMLADFYETRANRFVERGEPIRAAELLERIDDLHRFPDTRRESRQRARQLRRQAFGDDARQRFEAELQAELVDTEAYDPQSETLRMTIEQPPDSRFDPDDDDAVTQARRTAVQTVAPTLTQYAIDIGDLDPEQVDPADIELPELTVEDEDFGPGHYEMTVALELSGLVDMAFEMAEGIRRADNGESGAGAGVGQFNVDDGAIKLDTSAVDDDAP